MYNCFPGVKTVHYQINLLLSMLLFCNHLRDWVKNTAVVPAQLEKCGWLFISLASWSLTSSGTWTLSEILFSKHKKIKRYHKCRLTIFNYFRIYIGIHLNASLTTLLKCTYCKDYWMFWQIVWTANYRVLAWRDDCQTQVSALLEMVRLKKRRTLTYINIIQ